MQKRALQKEAEICRRLATHYVGLPEEPFLLKIAGAMEELALIENGREHSGARRPKRHL
jgi:hypothetical protein